MAGASLHRNSAQLTKPDAAFFSVVAPLYLATEVLTRESSKLQSSNMTMTIIPSQNLSLKGALLHRVTFSPPQEARK